MKNVRYALLATTMLSVVTLANLATATEVVERPYVRFDAGYSWSHFGKTTNLETHAQSGAAVLHSLDVRSGGSPSFSLGAGYIFTDNVRADITLQYSPNYKASTRAAAKDNVPFVNFPYPAGEYSSTTGQKVNVQAGTINGLHTVSIAKSPALKIRSLVTMGHLYYDFAGNPDFVPYVGISLGMAHLKVSDVKLCLEANPTTTATLTAGGTQTITVPLANDVSLGKGGTRNNFAYGATAGVGIRMNEFTTLDVSYRYVNLGKAKILKNQDATTKELHNHEAMVGVRYEF